MTNKNHAINIVDIFEDLLDEHNIYIPDQWREGEEGEACIYGDAYGTLISEVEDYLNTYTDENQLSICDNEAYVLVMRWSSEDTRMPDGTMILAAAQDRYSIEKLFEKHRTKELNEALEANWVVEADDEDYFYAYHEDMPAREFVALNIMQVNVI